MTVKNTISRWSDKFKDPVSKNIETTSVSYILTKIIHSIIVDGMKEFLQKLRPVLKKGVFCINTSSSVSRGSHRD